MNIISLNKDNIPIWIWRNEKYLRAWLYILFNVDENGESNTNNMSLRKISLDTNLSFQNTRTFLKLLKENELINIKVTRQQTRLIILNYDDYNIYKHSKQHSKQHTLKRKKSLKKEAVQNIELVYPFPSEKFQSAWADWIEYKWMEHKDKYKSIKTQQITLNYLAKESNNDEKYAIEMIYFSISKKWKGIYIPKSKNNSRIPSSEQLVPNSISLADNILTDEKLKNILEITFNHKNISDHFFNLFKNKVRPSSIKQAEYKTGKLFEQSGGEINAALAILNGTYGKDLTGTRY
jgi:hypothetical protein